MEDSKGGSDIGNTAGSTDVGQQQAIYGEKYNKTFLLKVFIAITVFMVLLALLFCIIIGAKDNRGELWLLIINLLISSFVTLTLCYWYKKGELASDKAWFLILVASILIFQTITTDIYVFNPVVDQQKPTSPPIITINPVPTNTTTTNTTS
ncbi:uncharacterized protein LOC117116998 [Anneissia japonica]|uniref:uncharacterized protein LOC117116998 n=1 Tax=Anneissia japonica TaxID=1529436 RepID=UPI001425A41E|nr:uncharacterized protein LOC117116998 [Anneissia japonica]